MGFHIINPHTNNVLNDSLDKLKYILTSSFMIITYNVQSATWKYYLAAHWRHNEPDGVSNHLTSLAIIYSTVYSGAGQRKQQSSPSLAFVRGIYRWPVNSPHKGPVTRKMFPFDDVIM